MPNQRFLIVVFAFLLIASLVSGVEVKSAFVNNALIVSVEGAVDLAGYQFSVNYDPGVLELRGAEEGPFLTNNGQDNTFFIYSTKEQNQPGFFRGVVGARLGDLPGVNGSGELARVGFTKIGEGDPGISLSGVIVTDSSAQKLDVQVGEVELVDVGQIPPYVQQGSSGNLPGMLLLTLVVAVVVIAGLYVATNKKKKKR